MNKQKRTAPVNKAFIAARSTLTLLLAFGVTVYGILSIACGGMNPPPNEPPVGQDESPVDEVPIEELPTAQPVEATQPVTGDETAIGAEDVRFAVDEVGLEMAIPMARHARIVGQRAVQTSKVVSGDWFLENFEYVGADLQIVANELLSQDVVIAMKHRNHDAEILVWGTPEDEVEAERFVDLIADDWIAKIVASDSLKAAQFAAAEASASRADLESLSFEVVELAGRKALQVDFQRVHPTSRARQRGRLLLLRQNTTASSVMLGFALLSRRDDYPTDEPELTAVAARSVLQGEAVELRLGPTRKLGPAGDEYGIDWKPLPEGKVLSSPKTTIENTEGDKVDRVEENAGDDVSDDELPTVPAGAFDDAPEETPAEP